MEKLPEAYQQQIEYVRIIWREKTYGLDRLVRLFLVCAQFVFPVLLIRDIAGRWGVVGRRTAVETYAVAKFLFPLLCLWFGWYAYPAATFLIIYLLGDTLIHLLHLIFLADVHSAAVSYRRSLLLIFLHYGEVIADFAVLYLTFGLLAQPASPLSALYFSTVATTTVGFGDITVRPGLGQVVAICQLLICVIFIVVFINYFSQKNGEKP